MATSVIKKPFNSYIIVASTSSTDTYKNKLLSLKSAFQGLSIEQKMKSFLFFGNTMIYRIQSFASEKIVFSTNGWGNNAKTYGSFFIVDLFSGERKEFGIKTDGAVYILDTTNTPVEINIRLGYWL